MFGVDSMFEKITGRGPTVEAIIKQFKEQLQRGLLQPGDLLPSEGALCEQLGVSRGSVREAMKILDAFGIVSVRRGNGTYISDSIENALIDPFLLTLMMSGKDIHELIEFREMLELQVVTLAVGRASEEDIAELGNIVAGMESLIGSESDKDKLVEADIRFHNALSQATRNTYVSRLYTYIMNFFQYYIAKTYENDNNIQSAYTFHSAIFQAVRDRDAARAVEITRQSIEDWAEKFKNFT